MVAYYKEGVCGQSNRHPQLMKAHGRIVELYEKYNEILFVTCISEGNHKAGSFHYINCAEDFKYGKASEKEIRETAGPGFDFAFHTSHIHMEYDPK